jgi:SAM-dependent methyltransferase
MTLYDSIGIGYASFRQPDPRIAAAIDAALGDAVTVANIGAGTGSYEPASRTVIAVEPSEIMIAQRPAVAAPCLQGSATDIPLSDRSVDAAMAILTIHHWPDLARGLSEMARIAKRRVVILTFVPGVPFWLTDDYFPDVAAHDRTIFPAAADLAALLERTIGPTRLAALPVPHDCVDGFLGAYWRRPDCYLNPDRRAAISSFRRIDAAPGLARLATDLDSGVWTQRHQSLAALDELDLGYRLAVCDITPRT